MKRVILWSIIPVVFIAVSFVIYNRTIHTTPGTVFFENTAGLGISIADFLEAEESNRILFSARIIDHGYLYTQVPVKSVPADLIYANLVSGLHMVNGVFPHLPDTIAISAELAVKWFFNTDILGAEVMIGDDLFTICGVFREETPVFSVENKNETVYLHLSAFPCKDTQITQLWIRPGNMLPAQVLDMASQLLDTKLMPVEITQQSRLRFR